VAPSWSQPHVVGDIGGGEAVLFEGGVVHEDIVVAIAEGVDAFVAVYIGGFERVAVSVGFFEQRSAEEVTKFGAVEGLALTGLDEVTFEHFVGFVVDLNLDAFLNSPAGIVPMCTDFLIERIGVV
jgi:hypothetical protein